MNPGIHRALLVLLAATIIGCDQGTKYVAASILADKPALSFFGDIFRLLYAENTGGFLGLGGNLSAGLRTALFTVGTGITLILFLFILIKFKWSPVQTAGITLFVAGGASNWFDRLSRGNVVDFLNVGIGWMRTGIFNFADVAIMAGMALLLIPGFQKRKLQAGTRVNTPLG